MIEPNQASDYVGFYEREFYPLSNFSAFRLIWKGHSFDTSEAAYHWEKFVKRPDLQLGILQAPSAHAAFRFAGDHKKDRRADWDVVKVPIMLDILRAKAAQHEYVRRKLLETGTRWLVEDSWRDDFWGWGANQDGENMLGQLWVIVRQEYLTNIPFPESLPERIAYVSAIQNFKGNVLNHLHTDAAIRTVSATVPLGTFVYINGLDVSSTIPTPHRA